MNAVLTMNRPLISRRWYVAVALFMLLILATQISVYAFSGAGGYISEKVLSRIGVNNSVPIIERSGVGGSKLDVVMGPIVTSLAATGVTMGGGTFATFNGRVDDLNGFPAIDIFWEWGYDTSYGNTAGLQSVGAIGDYSVNIAGYDPNETVHYRFGGESDGTVYGVDQSFLVQGGAAWAYRLLWGALTAVIALAIIISALWVAIAFGPIAALVVTFIGIIALILVKDVLTSMW